MNHVQSLYSCNGGFYYYVFTSVHEKMHIYEPKPSHGWKYEALDATTVEKMAKKHARRAKLISFVQFCSDPFLFINEIHSVQDGLRFTYIV